MRTASQLRVHAGYFSLCSQTWPCLWALFVRLAGREVSFKAASGELKAIRRGQVIETVEVWKAVEKIAPFDTFDGPGAD